MPHSESMTTFYIQSLRLSKSASGRRNWERTIATPVEFTESPYDTALTRGQRQSLLGLYPDGRCQFFGYHSRFVKQPPSLGDRVVFQGDKSFYAIATIGYAFRNTDLPDLLWDNENNYDTVYSLHNLFDLRGGNEVPTLAARQAEGKSDDFSHRRFVHPQSEAVQDFFADTFAWYVDETNAEAAATDVLADSPTDTMTRSEVPAHRFQRGVRRIGSSTQLFDRAEAALVQEYQEYASSRGHETWIDRGTGRISDLVDNVSLEDVRYIEAKVLGTLPSLRQAYGQLVDYISHSEINV